MSLRKQLLAFGLLTLVLPWAGYRFVQEMEATLRAGLERALLASADTVAAALGGRPALEGTAAADSDDWHDSQDRTYAARADGSAAPAGSGRPSPSALADDPTGTAIYASPLNVADAPVVDGSRDDWTSQLVSAPPDAGSPLGARDRYWAGIQGRSLYLYVEATDPDLVYEGPPGTGPYGDRLVLELRDADGAERWLLLSTRAPGQFRAQRTAPPLFKPTGDYEDRVVAAWQETPKGFAVETRVPLTLAGRGVGLAVVDVDHEGDGYSVSVAQTSDLQSAAPGPLIYERPDLNRLLGEFGRAGSRFRVLNRDGWVLADTGSIAPAAEPAPLGLADRLFAALLQRHDPAYDRLESRPGRLEGAPLGAALVGRPAAAWYRDGPGGSTVVAAGVPIRAGGRVVGAVLLEQASDPILTLTDRALVRLMSFTLLATAVAAAGLLGFATLLSVRVRRLARAAETAVGPKGEIEVGLPGRGAGDEIGDLARSFGRLLERLREHTQYLRTLAGKLSHELRTPLAVVSTSLDNLEQEVAEPSALPYLARLRQGTARLDSILAAMGEATRIEQAIGDTRPEPFDLAAVVESCSHAYADIYKARRFACRIETGAAEAFGSAELTAQLIDKLVDNAVSFSPPESLIEIGLDRLAGEWRLRVRNAGPLLPEGMRSRLFDSMVSLRGRDDGQPHLGLGLHIVALIAEFHGGSAEAANLPDGTGVEFGVTFPARGSA